MPRRFTVASHVDGDHAIPLREVRCEVIETMGDARDAVKEHERLSVLAAPFEIVNAHAFCLDESIAWLTICHEHLQSREALELAA
jgi:hypothetical protein